MRAVSITLLITTMSLLGLPSVAHAESCAPIFGGGKTCQTSTVISLKKEVKNPTTNAFVSSLSKDGPYFAPDQRITFRITVENKSKSKITNVSITDTFPQYFTYVVGNGNFDKSKKTLTTKFDALNAGEKRSYEIMGKVASASQLVTLKSEMNCFINQIASSTKGTTAQTNTQYCVSKMGGVAMDATNQNVPSTTKGGIVITPTPQAAPTQTTNGKVVYDASQTVEKVPSTGAEVLSLFALFPVALAGFVLRKKGL